MMPHKHFEPEAFAEKATELRSRFDRDSDNTLFLDSTASSLNVPLDGMPVYVDQTWEVIRNQKELNLPDQAPDGVQLYEYE